MSGSQAAVAVEQEEGGAGAAPVAPSREDIERRARLSGWKPFNEYRGDKQYWRDAEEFLARGEQELPIVRERNRVLEERMLRMEKEQKRSAEVLEDMAERTRRADERAMKRLRAELDQKRAQAVERGDMDEFRRVDAEMQSLDAPVPAPARAAPAAASAAAPPAVAPAIDPAVHRWVGENPWFTQYPDLMAKAQKLHQGIVAADPDIGLQESLDTVASVMARQHPDRVQLGRGAPPAAAAPPEEDPPPEDNRRRQQPAPVNRGREVGRRVAPRSFDAMPQDSKDAYARYKAMVDSKHAGKPLTKEEWAEDYWSQED